MKLVVSGLISNLGNKHISLKSLHYSDSTVKIFSYSTVQILSYNFKNDFLIFSYVTGETFR